ncbi:MAG: tRNA (N6-isopentenyl adenosine(37)-C2)-methylthiotransferase MiaB [Clostridia bacterium]|nr:tRNA (N6-isopentenyl adenosine(37)-C2)-methylthiotransferase MiaB [Clostridia bacterium]
MEKDLILYASQNEYIDKVRRFAYELELKRNHKPLYFTHTFGCQQNESDTEKINGMLSDMGFEKTDVREDADVIIYNTCAVREHAEQRVFGTIGSLVGLKRERPSVVVGFCGCMMQRNEVSEELRKKYKHVNLVFGTHAIGRFPENLYKALTSGERVFDVIEQKGKIVEDIPVKRGHDFKAWVSVMYGCNNFCSYCIVPYVRGRERSRDPQRIIDEVTALLKDGYKDITLLGQNVNSFCNDSDSDWNFAKLLRRINEIEGDFRIRFMTSHPKDATKELIDTIAECDKVCNHLHLPFQSGSDRVLDLMNRRYTREKYKSLVDYAKSKIPDLVLTSDVIVGFPTETEEDFLETMSLVDEIGFQGLYTFIYSVRKGTPAAEMEQVDEKVKHDRFDRLCALQTEKATQFNSKFIGKTVKVLVEGFTGEDKANQTGRTEGNIIVNFPACGAEPGTYKNVLIDKALNWAIFGQAID